MLNHREFLLHPTSMQSLVSSSGGGGPSGSGGASNPGLRIAESSRHEDEVDENSVYCDLSRPTATANTGGRNQHNSLQQSVSVHSATRRERARTPAPAAATTKRISCLRTGLLAAFVLILLGVIVTSSYAIDKRLSQMPQLLYVGLGLCSAALCLIVVCISLLVARQLGKQQQQQEQRQRQRQRRHSATRRSASARQQDAAAGQSSGRVPIWYIGCHRDTATAYCPPVPPSYWDSTSSASASVAASNSQKPLRPMPPPPPPPPQQQQQPSQLQQRVLPQPPLPPSPPSYQEALRCLEQRSPQQPPEQHHQISRPSSSLRQVASRQPVLASSDQMSVLKWTVQSQHHHQLHHQRLQQQQQQQQQHQQLSNYRSYQRQNSVDSSSFIGEPILV